MTEKERLIDFLKFYINESPDDSVGLIVDRYLAEHPVEVEYSVENIQNYEYSNRKYECDDCVWKQGKDFVCTCPLKCDDVTNQFKPANRKEQ
jgi:hypothetical protein